MGGNVALGTTRCFTPTGSKDWCSSTPRVFRAEEPRPLVFRLAASPLWGRVIRWETPRFMVSKSLHDVYGDPSRVDDALVDRY